MELLRDLKFQQGFDIGHVDALISRDPIGKWVFKPNSNPEWKICQWCTNHNLLEGKRIHLGNIASIENIAKKVEINHFTQTISLEVFGQHEYLKPRLENEGWPHLLLEQFFINKYVKNFNYFTVNIDVSFDGFHDFMNDDRNNLHTCQFQWFFAIGKRNQITNEVDDFFWFGIGLADYPRYDFVPPYQAIDGGKEENTNKFIYIIDSKQYLNEPLIPGSRVRVTYNAFDEMKQAYQLAQARGYLRGVEFEELEIISTNIGIEMTGTFQAKFTVRKINVEI